MLLHSLFLDSCLGLVAILRMFQKILKAKTKRYTKPCSYLQGRNCSQIIVAMYQIGQGEEWGSSVMHLSHLILSNFEPSSETVPSIWGHPLLLPASGLMDWGDPPLKTEELRPGEVMFKSSFAVLQQVWV